MAKPLERDLQTVYSLAEPQPITGVSFGFWPISGGKSGKGGPKRAWAVFTTKERVYEVQGDVTTTSASGKNGGWPEELFKMAREGAPSELDPMALVLTRRIPRAAWRSALIVAQDISAHRGESVDNPSTASFLPCLANGCRTVYISTPQLSISRDTVPAILDPLSHIRRKLRRSGIRPISNDWIPVTEPN
jgi:hypothetical protein